MEVQIKVLIPIIVVLALLVIVVVIITCYFYIWPYCTKKKKQNVHYSKLVNPNLTMAKDRRKQRKPRPPNPTIIRPSTPPAIRTKTTEQSTRYKNVSTSPYYNESILGGKHLSVGAAGGASNNFLSTSSDKKPLLSPGGIESECGDDEIFYFADDSSLSLNKGGSSSSASITQSEETNNNLSQITIETKNRFRSEPILNTYSHEELGIDLSVPVNREQKYRSKRTSSRTKTRPKALSVLSPANGKIEFTLFYNAEEKLLTINLVQLTEILLKPECFIGILSVFDKEQTKERKKSNTVHLIRSPDHTLQLSDYADTGFLLYLTLLPDMKFSRHTSVVFGNDSAIFNERFSIPCQDENLKKSSLCIHSLCKFGRDGEPIVLGEVNVPLKRLQNSQVLPFMAELQCPSQEIELEPYLKPSTELGSLEIYLSFNPMASTLIVKILQASSLPKIGMTGHPNVSIKTALYYCNLRVAKKTTSIQKRQRSPIFNETFEFNLSKDRISECDVLFEIRHHGPMYRTVIGYVIVGNSAGGEGTKQWRQLLDFSCHEKQYKIMPKKPVGLP